MTLEFAQSHTTAEKITEEEKVLLPTLVMFKNRFHEHMEDDFNTADAISIIFELVKFANTYAKEGASREFITEVLDLFNELVDVLGLIYSSSEASEGLTDEEIQDYITRRKEAKKAKDFAEADRIREELKDKGVLIEDTREGVRFKRI